MATEKYYVPESSPWPLTAIHRISAASPKVWITARTKATRLLMEGMHAMRPTRETNIIVAPMAATRRNARRSSGMFEVGGIQGYGRT